MSTYERLRLIKRRTSAVDAYVNDARVRTPGLATADFTCCTSDLGAPYRAKTLRARFCALSGDALL